MNERIKELVEKSYIYDRQNDSSFFNKEKFAELIVRECIGVVEGLSPGYKDYRDQIEDAFRRDCVTEIKHKFGIEE